ncbi:DEAD-domain-containing protein [Ascodesmis nigricans]|uniref:RNA helicase n=1 Tax=Ascodesmis nigricans TaxID=341454 RepID=A0A4V3SJD5_9PEZI|nr:DEAD-domain-containing protein [Ascodesmis nigricans]
MSKRTIDEVEAGAPVVDKASKKKSKKEKKEKKEKKSKDVPVTQPEDTTPAVEGSETPAEEKKKLSKEERKALKKAAKAAAKAATSESTTTTPEETGETTPATSESPAPTLSKEERRALKKAAKVAKSSSSIPATNGASSTAKVAISTENYTQSSELTDVPQATIDAYMKEHSITITDPHNLNFRPITNFSYLPPNSFDFSKFEAPTPIQAATWPFTISGHDCIGVAETGSGKTLAFSVPAIRHIYSLLEKNSGKNTKSLGVRVVVVSPTRELAMQIFEVVEKFSTEAGLTAVCVYGGVPKDDQRRLLKRAQVVVATPGRLNDFIDEGSADLSKVSYIVLDEADRMLDKGFEDAIRKIIGSTPKTGRQTLMFTATWPQSVRELASTFMTSPVKISIGDRDELRANTRIKQTVEVIDQRGKEQRLLQLVKQYQSGSSANDRILVFCLYKKEASRIESFLRSRGYSVAGIHGDLSQVQRTQALANFKSGKCPLMVATDVAARGLDIPAVKMVINVTFPLTIEDYVHRIGRTGRAGATGIAYTFFTEHDKAHSGALVNILKAANQEVPESLLKFGTTVKKKEHGAYGAFYKKTEGAPAATKITFDD